ncbi:MAG: glutamine amidotransferase [Proteobacteria bacterium]|nr:glutamine amidotransferase [Pseudomonadota bacterium]
MAKQFLIIKTGTTIPSLLANTEDFEDWFILGSGRRRCEFLVCSIHLHQALPRLATIDGIIITGSPAYLTDLESWNYIAADYLRNAHADEIPILGVCYGHQLVAWTFGGSVDFHRGGREIGTVEIKLTASAKSDPLFASLPDKFKAQVSHQQTVTQLPEEAVLLAENNFERHHAFRLGLSTWGVQFHPEFSDAVTRAYISERRVALTAEGLDPDRLLRDTVPTPEAAGLIRHFVQIVVKGLGGA